MSGGKITFDAAIDHGTDGALILNNMLEGMNTFKERNAVYKNNWWPAGRILREMFPSGITLKTEDDFTRFAVLVQKAGKMTRYAANFHEGGHSDSIKDDGVYSFILSGIDESIEGMKELEKDLL